MYQLYVFILKFISIYINISMYKLFYLYIYYYQLAIKLLYNLTTNVGMLLDINGPRNKNEKDVFVIFHITHNHNFIYLSY